MPKIDLTDPKNINFYIENYTKVSSIQNKWWQRHAKKFEKAATFRNDVKNYTQTTINESVMVAGMATITRDHIVAAKHRKTAPIPDHLTLKKIVPNKEQLSMKPVDIDTKELLYVKSRKEYLKKRNLAAPENKFVFMESSNWAYGWKLDESNIKMCGPAYGRVCHTLHNLRSRVGPQPDPDHYISPDDIRGVCV